VPPFTPGHEPFGVVEAVGPRVKGVKVGRGASCIPGSLRPMSGLQGGAGQLLPEIQIPGVNRAGAIQRTSSCRTRNTWWTRADRRVVRGHARLLGADCLQREREASALGAKDRVAVIGCGGVGLVGISVLRAKGVRNIIACDIDEAKLAAAARLGAKTTLDTAIAGHCAEAAGVAGGSLRRSP